MMLSVCGDSPALPLTDRGGVRSMFTVLSRKQFWISVVSIPGTRPTMNGASIPVRIPWMSAFSITRLRVM